MSKTKQYTEQAIDEMVQVLINQIKDSGNQYDYVVGIRNGGINISIPVAEALGLPHKSVKISAYDDMTKLKNVQINKGDFEWKPNGLIVDDLIDTGATITSFKKIIGGGDVAVLFWKKEADADDPEFYVEEKPDEWVVFPWEV